MNNLFDEKTCIEEINHFTSRFKVNLENVLIISEWTKEHIYFCLIDYFKSKEIESSIINTVADGQGQYFFTEENFLSVLRVAYKVYNSHNEYNIDNEFIEALSKIVELFLLPDHLNNDDWQN
jgi:hypothetical protein